MLLPYVADCERPPDVSVMLTAPFWRKAFRSSRSARGLHQPGAASRVIRMSARRQSSSNAAASLMVLTTVPPGNTRIQPVGSQATSSLGAPALRFSVPAAASHWLSAKSPIGFQGLRLLHSVFGTEPMRHLRKRSDPAAGPQALQIHRARQAQANKPRPAERNGKNQQRDNKERKPRI